MKKTIDIELELQPMIDRIPTHHGDPYKRACSGDELTVNSWRETWIKNYRLTKERFGEMGDLSYGQLFGKNRYKPAIICGSGPSLKDAIPALKKNSEQPNPIMNISALHNFGYFEDEGFHADYYLSLDAGEIVTKDIWEGRDKTPEEYYEATKDQTLIASTFSPPELFDAWKGKVYLVNCLIPDLSIRAEFDKIERFACYISGGGNVTGGCIYTAKAVMGSGEIIVTGFDCCFSYDHKFHSYSTDYDNFNGGGIGKVIRWPDIYGIPRSTWPSYYNFKCWADWLTMNVPGRWASASGGIWGAYPEGNLSTIRYGELGKLLETYEIADMAKIGEFDDVTRKPKLDANGEFLKTYMDKSEYFKNPKQEMDFVFF